MNQESWFKPFDMALSLADRLRHGMLVLAIGAVLVVMAPFNTALALATGDQPIARVVVFVALGFTGLICANRVGLVVPARRLRHPLLTPLAVGAIVAFGIVIVDCVLFRPALRPDYVDVFRTNGLAMRLLFFMPAAYVENVLYRLLLMSVFVWLMGLVWRDRDGAPSAGAFWTALTLAQVINIWINVIVQLPDPVTPLTLAYDGLRYVLPGVVWGYLYWRHGFVAAEIASVGAHPFLQPALGYCLG